MSLLLEKFLIKNGYTNFNKHDIFLQLQTHPNNQSFRAFTDTLDYFGIENLAVKVSEDALEILPKDFLTIIDNSGSELVLASKKNDYILTEDENGKKTRYKIEDFKKVWSNNIIAIETTNKNNSFSKFINYWPIIPIVLLFTFLFLKDPSLLRISTVALSGIGLYISYLLVKEKIGYHSPSVLAVCTSLPNSNCNDVINSKGGNLTKDVSLADASFLYFLIFFANSIFFEINALLSVTILMALPIIIFSLYYQGIIIKKWCLLCIGVLGILGLLGLSLLWGMDMSITGNEVIVYLLIMSFLLPSYFYIKNLIESNKKGRQEIIAFKRFKRNPETFGKIMTTAKVVSDTELIENEIIIGNPAASKQIIAFTNPLCGFCKKAFEAYVKIIEINTDIRICLRFSSRPNDFESSQTKIDCRLIEIYQSQGAEEFINVYLSWFKDKDIDGWLKKYKYPKYEEGIIAILKKHQKWAVKNEITFTPTTIINKEIFPSGYDYDDLVYMINDIFEFQTDKTTGL